MNEPESSSDRFDTVVAVLIAVVTVVGAVVAWRVSVALNDGAGADTRGILATVEREDVTTRAAITLMGHRTAYAAFVSDDALARAYSDLARANPKDADLSNFASAFRLAANYALYPIPAQYLDRDRQLDQERDLGENIAQYSINKDIEPQPHFAAADQSRQKAGWLLINVILLGMALILLTTANAVESRLRYLFLLASLLFLLISALAALLIELVGVPALRIL
jgi:uncharacterized integral membrane protein